MDGDKKWKGLTAAGGTVSPKDRQPTPHLQLGMERFKRQRRNGNNNVDFGQKEGQVGATCFLRTQPRRAGVQINGR